MLDQDTIDAAFSDAQVARGKLCAAVDDETDKKTIYDTKRVHCLLLGVEGKNAEMRNAALEDELVDELTELDLAQAETRLAKNNYDIAMLEVDRIKQSIRWAEVMKE